MKKTWNIYLTFGSPEETGEEIQDEVVDQYCKIVEFGIWWLGTSSLVLWTLDKEGENDRPVEEGR